MTVRQHRIIQWFAITLILALGAGWYYQTRVRGAQTFVDETPSFQADLKNTLDLQGGIGKPTFTRATTATGTDFEGLIKTVKSGEARFEGARRVENLAPHSEDFSNATWYKVYQAPAVLPVVTTNAGLAPDGTNTADRVVIDYVSSGGFSRVYQQLSTSVNGAYVYSIWLKTYDESTKNIAMRLSDSNGTVTSSVISVSGTWKRFSVLLTNTNAITYLRNDFLVWSSLGTSQSADLLAWGAQVENVTGQSNQNPSEYVSTNVKTSAPYHGANVDGVKYFTTYNGNTVASNVVTEATGAAIPDATLHGYVAEGARTNLLTNSKDLIGYTVNGTTLATNQAVSPMGDVTMAKITETATNNVHYFYKNLTTTDGGIITGSVYVKKGTRRYVGLQLGVNNNSIRQGILFDLDTGLFVRVLTPIGSPANLSYGIQSLPNGVFRIYVSMTSGGAGTDYIIPFLSGSSNPTDTPYSAPFYTGDVNNYGYFWGAQLEQASFASSYIPTTTTSVTRNVDVLTYPTAGNVDGTKGTAYAEAVTYRTSTVDSSAIIISARNYSVPVGGVPMYIDNNPNALTLYDGGTERNFGAVVIPFTQKKFATNWSGAVANGYISGVKTAGSFNGDLNVQAPISIGAGNNGIANLFGTIRNVKIWKKALTDGQLTNLTSATDAVSGSAVRKTIVGSDNPSFQADLKNMLDLQAGAGKATFTRATTATGTDFEGLVKTAKSGEARFEGARRVENLAPHSEDFSNATWYKVYQAPAVLPVVTTNAGLAPDGTNTADRVVIDYVSSGGFSRVYQQLSTSVNGAYVYSIWLKTYDESTKNIAMRLSDSNGTVTSSVISVSGTWKRFSVLLTNTNAITYLRNDFLVWSSLGTSQSADLLAWGAQVENVTGQSNQNPSEYVSTNVKTSAPYHGANVDGVKYFTTYNGNTVASNVVTEATGAAIPDATLHGYVAEGARTNLLTNSKDLIGYTVNGTTLATNQAVSPMGDVTMAKITETATNNVHYFYKNLTTTDGGIITGSVYVKKGTRRYVGLQLGVNNNSIRQGILFDLDTGLFVRVLTPIGSPANLSYGIQSLPNGVFRIYVSMTSGGAGTDYIIPFLSGSSNPTDTPYSAPFYTGDVNNYGYFWGAQLEQASFASSYIPTTTTSVTRNADVLTYPTSGNMFGATENGTVYFEAKVNETPTGTNNQYMIAFSSNFLSAAARSYTTAQTFYHGATSINLSALTKNILYKFAMKADGTNFSVFKNSVKSSIAQEVPASVDTVSIGVYSGNALFGTIRNVKIWKKALTDGQLTNMTSATDAVANSAVKKTTVNASQNDKLTSGLVGQWSFNGPDISGTTAYDRSGSGNNGTLTNGPVSTIGKVGQALSFDGVNDYVANGTGYNGIKTVALWVQPNTTTQSILDLNGTQTIDIVAGTVRANSFTSPTIYVDSVATSTFPNTLGHLVVITTNTAINASAFNMGKIATAYLNGKLDDVRVYNRALSATEISDLYNMSRDAWPRQPWTCGVDSVADSDSNAYNTVLIGNQCWMKQNLMTTTYPGGASITRGPVGATWNGADNAYYAYPPNVANTAEETLANIQTNSLGFVYQWSAAMNGSTTEGTRGICPAGWHLPTDAQQDTLDQYLKDSNQTCNANRNGAWDCSSAGTKLKLGGTSGFNGPLAGYRGTTGGFYNRGSNGYFWSSSQSGGSAWNRTLYTSIATVHRYANSKADGFSVRCLKD
jgi:uncharacterized protein (TIGR02145 family)